MYIHYIPFQDKCYLILYSFIATIIFSIPLSKRSQTFSKTCGWFKTEILFQRSCISVCNGNISRLHWYQFHVCLKIIISRKYLGCYQFFLQNSHKIKQILRRIIPNIVYFIGGNRKTILAIFLFWRMLHNTYYTFHNVIYIGEVTLTVTIVLPSRNLLVKPKYAISGRPAGP